MRYLKFILLIFVFASCAEETPKKESKESFLCDAETVDGDFFTDGDAQFKGSWLRSKKHSRSGKYSVCLNKKGNYGMVFEIKDIKKGDIIEASLWRHNSASVGSLVIAEDDEGVAQYFATSNLYKTEGDWGKLRGMYIAHNDYKKVLVYAFYGGDKNVYFDDLKIDIYRDNEAPAKEHVALEINIPESAYDTLMEFRKTALSQGVITKDLKEYINAELNVEGTKMPVELRLKGDWTDHLETNKWSFRIKVGDGHAFRGMRTFSIQNPSTRSFMMEWFAHKLFEREDILTTRYIFVPVMINGEKKGVYALEEHFDKQLLEHRKRREGPIVKFDESGVWQLHYLQKNEHRTHHVPDLASAEILPFKKNRTYKSPTLTKQFRVAQFQMERYKNHDPAVDEYFNVDDLARFIALSDVINGKHGTIWHNQRNYFNPVTNKLEPIAYDCFMESNLLTTEVTIDGLARKNKDKISLIEAVLGNPKVEKKYFEYLQKFSNKKYLKDAFKELSKEIKSAEKLLNYEYPNIHLEQGFFENNAKQVRSQLKEYSKERKNLARETEELEPFEILPEGVIFTDIALKANLEQLNANGSARISLRNYHSSDIEVFGYSTKEDKKTIVPIARGKVSAFDGTSQVVEISLPVKPRRLHWRAKNCPGQSFKSKINKWGAPTPISIISKNAEVGVSHHRAADVVLSGKVILTRDFVVPEGLSLIVDPGTEIIMKNKASLISYSPAHFNGTESDPIRVHSPDGSANGVVVISTKKSRMHYTTFDNLNTMNKNNWTLTGAVTYYGGDVTIDHCNFINNNCEDGLNLIRCKFNMTNSTVANTFSDGFDADFCTGVLKHSTFEKTGNDCIDFSGSEIDISYCKIIDAGDKGISGGEDSDLNIEYCTIERAHIAIASKDLSRVKVANVTILKAKYGFAAYRKKPEYGGAKIIVESMKKMNADKLHLLEKGSSMRYINKDYYGKKTFDIDAMYAMYEK